MTVFFSGLWLILAVIVSFCVALCVVAECTYPLPNRWTIYPLFGSLTVLGLLFSYQCIVCDSRYLTYWWSFIPATVCSAAISAVFGLGSRFIARRVRRE